MARRDVLVLGAGIVGTSIALHLAKRGVSVALVDKRGPGEETSYGNTGVLEGNTLFPHAFPANAALLKIALKLAPEANYHLAALPHIAPYLFAYRANSAPEKRMEFAEAMRPLFSRAVAEHEALMQESGSTRYLRKEGWIKLYRSESAFASNARELEVAGKFGLRYSVLDTDGTRTLEPSLSPVFTRSIHWPDAATVSNPLMVTRSYAARFGALAGVVLTGDARKLRKTADGWRIDTDEGALDVKEVVIALGPWAPDILEPLGIKLPLNVKRGYHRHYKSSGNAGLTRVIVDTENGYCLAPMEQGIRITTGAEFADRDAEPTPVQLDRLMPAAKGLFPLGEPIEAKPWMGSRPCFADSRPVIGRAPGQSGMWLAYGHAHWGLTLGPVTGRLVADMMTGTTPFCDPAPYRAERFGNDRHA